MKTRLLILVIALSSFTLLGCATVQKLVAYPSAKVLGVDVGGISFTGLTLTFDVEIENPYTATLPLVGVDYALSSEGKTFMEGELDTDVRIPAKEKRVVPLKVKLPFRELYDLGSNVKEGSVIPYRADLGLKVEAPVVGSIKLPVDTEGEITVPRLP